MQKGLAFFSAAFAVGVLVASVVACEDDNPSTFDGGAEGDASFDSGGSFKLDGSTPSDTKGPVNCTPSLPATFAPVWKPPPARASQCSTEDMAAYYDTCIANAKIADPACLAWVEAHKTCADCVEPDDNSGVFQIYQNRAFYTLNTAGCIALGQKQLGEDKCGAKFDRAAQCRRQSCDECFTAGGNFQNFIDCQNKAAQTGCKTYEDQADVACVGYKDPDGGAPDCFRRTTQNEQERAHFLRVMGLMCGPP